MKDKILTGLIFLFVLIGLYLSLKITKDLNAVNQRIDRQNSEYQLVMDTDSVMIFDGSRPVGKVKLEGDLQVLLMEDNL
jgi:hypothetical protein